MSARYIDNIHRTLYWAPKNTAGAVYPTWELEQLIAAETVARKSSVTLTLTEGEVTNPKLINHRYAVTALAALVCYYFVSS